MEKIDDKAGDPPSYPDVASAPSSYIKPQARKLYDSDVKFEEYHYYALRTRAEQDALPVHSTSWREILLRKKPAHKVDTGDSSDGVPPGVGSDSDPDHRGSAHPDHANLNISDRHNRLLITDKEWSDASRALRSATWGAVFFLITTDVLGPYGMAFTLSTTGWGPGIALIVAFGLTATYSGYCIWRSFLGLDSHEFPLKNYGDLAFRTYGTIFRHLVNVVQVLGLLLILGQVTILNGQAISQVARNNVCYALCPFFFICAGFLIGQIRTLRNYGWVANFAVWLNLLVIFISMGVIANSPPNYEISVLGSGGATVNSTTITPNAAGVYPPVMHYSALPPNSLVGSINGVLSAVLAYAGAQLFCEFLAEMRRPRDFLKSLLFSQVFIVIVYLSYGSFVYYYQGQYTFSTSYQGISIYAWQVVGDMIALLSGLIAAGLYGNIGIKVLYNNILADIFNAPPLYTRSGKIFWIALVPVWWSIAYVIAAAIPAYFVFVSLLSSVTLLPLTYVFPPIMALGYDVQLNAMKADAANGFDPATGQVTRQWTGIQRWIRGYFAGGTTAIMFNVWHTLYALASLSFVGLGMYATIKAMISTYSMPQVNAFVCNSPLFLPPPTSS